VISVFPIKSNSRSPKLTVKIQEAIIFFFFLNSQQKEQAENAYVIQTEEKKIQLLSNLKINKQF
jgi:hypothetical protein